MIEIEILGNMRIRQDGVTKWTPFKSGGALTAFLAFHAPAAVERKAVAAAMFPGESYSASGNRLRVLIARTKKLLGDALHANAHELRLIPGEVEIDYFHVQKKIQQIVDEVDEDNEYKLLGDILPDIDQDLLPGIDESWVLERQEEWRRDCVSKLKRRMMMALDRRDWNAAAQAARMGLRRIQGDEQLWRGLFRAGYNLGELELILQDFNKAIRSKPDLMKDEFSSALLEYADELGDGEVHAETRWLDSELIALGRFFTNVMERKPEDAGNFLRSDGAIAELMNDPDALMRVLHLLVDGGNLSKAVEQDLRMRIADTASMVYDWEEVVRQTDIILEQGAEGDILARACFRRSFSFFQQRDYEKAFENIDKSISIFEEIGSELWIFITSINRTSYMWHRGEFVEALGKMDRIRHGLESHDTYFHKVNILVISCNEATIQTARGDWEKAMVAIRRGLSYVSLHGTETLLAMLYTISGLVFVVNGEASRGVDLLADGLKRSYRHNSAREMQIGLEWAAGALIHFGAVGEGFGLLKWVDDWRGRTAHPRSVAETMYVDRMLSETGWKGDGIAINPDENPQLVIKYAVQMLRSKLEGRPEHSN